MKIVQFIKIKTIKDERVETDNNFFSPSLTSNGMRSSELPAK